MTEIEFVGYSAVHPSDFIYDVPNGFTGYLLLLFDSPSELLIDGRLMRTAANSAILYTPGSRIYYRAAGEEYRNDWIRFRSDHSFVKLFPLTNTPFPVTDPEYCHQREATKDFSHTIPWEEVSLRRLIEISGNSVSGYDICCSCIPSSIGNFLSLNAKKPVQNRLFLSNLNRLFRQA